MRTRRPVAVALLALLTGGCFGLGRTQVEAPSVELDRIIVRSTSSAGATVELVLPVHNPNRFELHGTYVRLALEADGVALGEVRADEPFVLPPRTTTDLVVPLRVEWSGTGAATRRALSTERVRYLLNGRIGIEAGGTKLAIPVAREGTVAVLGPGS